MDGKTAYEQLIAYTKDVCSLLKVPFDAHGRPNYYREWAGGRPTGFLAHFTASNAAVSPNRQYGRLPVLLRRFARNSGSPGVHLIAWDVFMPQFKELRAKYEVFEHLHCDIFCWGLDVAFYHGNDANRWAVGIENRNIGKLTKLSENLYGWGRKGKNTYVGRKPILVRGKFWCEPFTLAQIMDNVQLIRWLREIHPIEPMKVLGHENITSTRTDPSPHYPLKMVRDLAFDDNTSTDILRHIFTNDADFFNRYDEWIEHDLIGEDVDIEDAFGREGSCLELELDEAEGELYGDDGVVTTGNVMEAKQALIQLGYWPMGPDDVILNAQTTDAFKWTLKLFQRRWVKITRGRKVRVLRDTGIVDRPTAAYLNQMLRQWELLP